MKKGEIIDTKQQEHEDSTNWKVWYWGLIAFLAAQIALYLTITNWYK